MDEQKIDELNRAGIERALLSILVANPEKCDECLGNLKAKDFGIKSNAIIYSSLMQLTQIDKLKEIDSIILYNSIKDNTKEEVDKMGGLNYIQALFDSELTDNLYYYIKEIKKTAKRREAIIQLEKSIKMMFEMEDEEEPLNEVIKLNEKLLDLSAGEVVEVTKFGEGTRERLMKRRENPEEVSGLPIGWKQWDKVTQGFANNDLAVFVAPSGVGKSTLLLNFAERLIQTGLKGLYIDTEMQNEEQEDRLLSILSGVPNEEIRNGFYGQDTEYGRAEDKIRKVDEATAYLEGDNACLWHINTPEFTIEKITALIKQYKKKYDIDFVVFDYIKMPSSGSAMKENQSEWQQLGFLSSALKEVANMLKIPVLTAVQTNRGGEKAQEFSQEFVSGSARIIHNATKVYFLRRKTEQEMAAEGYKQGNMLIQIYKQRHGGVGKQISISFEKEIIKMKEV